MAAVFDGAPLLPSGYQQRDSKYPEFAEEYKRSDTFLTWPHTNHITAETMADHYLFYTGND